LRQQIEKARHTGSSIVETVAGSIFIVIVALFLVDMAAVVVCQTQNDALAKHCARAAAACDDNLHPGSAQTAINDVTTQFVAQNGGSKICSYVSASMTYNYNAATVNVITVVNCSFPVPIPFGPAALLFQTDATEPIVAVLPPNP
jgi:hypothetical protein